MPNYYLAISGHFHAVNNSVMSSATRYDVDGGSFINILMMPFSSLILYMVGDQNVTSSVPLSLIS